MSWYWIILIVLGYLVVAVITGVLYGVVLDEDNEMCTIAGVFWPVMLPIFICMLPFVIIHEILDCIL